MSKVFWFGCLVLSLVSYAEPSSSSSSANAAAADRYADLETKALENARRRLMKTTIDLSPEQEKAKDALVKATDAILAANEIVTQANAKLAPAASKLGNSYTSDAEKKEYKGIVAGLQVQVDRAKANQANASKALAEAEDRLAKLTSTEMEAKANLDPAMIQSEFKDLRNYLASSGILEQTLDRLAAKKLGLDLRLEALERRMDDTMIGSYVREKITRLITSGTLCKLSSFCQGDGKVDTKAVEEALDGIFFDNQGKLGRKRDGSSKNTH